MLQLNSIERFSFATQQLVTDFPPQWRHPNKTVVYEIASPPGSAQTGNLGYTRWTAVTLDQQVDISSAASLVSISPGYYDYVPVSAERSAVEWHVNFADPSLFGFYGSGLFAQDEMQVAEHPALGSLLEALLSMDATPTTEDSSDPTPVLVTGVERRVAISTNPDESKGRPHGLYGNNFDTASTESVRQATKAIVPPTISNIIAMSAPAMGRGRYSSDQIKDVLTIAATGFRAAVSESKRIHDSGTKTIIHTGFLGLWRVRWQSGADDHFAVNCGSHGRCR